MAEAAGPGQESSQVSPAHPFASFLLFPLPKEFSAGWTLQVINKPCRKDQESLRREAPGFLSAEGESH